MVSALVHEHYAEIHQFPVSILDTSDPAIATRLAEQTILEAVEGAHNYRQNNRVQVWISQGESVDASADDSNLIKKAIDSLEVVYRLTYLLRYYYPEWQCDI